MKNQNQEPRMSARELTRQYKKMLASHTTPVQPNRVNVYFCDCGTRFKTIDIHCGVTPMFMGCTSCDEMAKSSFYFDIAPELKPSIEWYRPSLNECLKLRKKEAYWLEHILKGGLKDRKIIKL